MADAPDMILAGGHVIDPANGINGLYDVAIRDGRITAVAPALSASDATQVIDVSGRYVTPGIIDLHAHVAISHGRSSLSLDPHVQTFSSGVTTVVDAGTTGWRDFSRFRREVIDRARIRVLAFVNIVGEGMGGDWEHDVSEMRPALAAAIASEYSDVVVGIKTAHYWTEREFDDAHPAWAAVDRALEAGDICNKPVMVDMIPFSPGRPYAQLLEKLRPGDIHTHVFAQQFPILTDDGVVQDFMWEARARGVRFDLGHGAASFWYRIASPAMAQGFMPDTISTDLHTGNVNGPVFDMQTTMNKALALGMPLEEVIQRSTTEPARGISRPDLGTLSVGMEADIAVFDIHDGPHVFIDCGKAVLSGHQRLACALTLRAGEVVFNPNGLGLPDWQTAPARYWTCSMRVSSSG